jgi:hypothetical protein
VDKIERDGKVAVLYSPGFGAGWSTWNSADMRDVLCMDADIVQAVLNEDRDLAAKVAEAKFPAESYVCVLGARDLKVEWIPKGTAFEIEEYDGNESIHEIGSRSYSVA